MDQRPPPAKRPMLLAVPRYASTNGSSGSGDNVNDTSYVVASWVNLTPELFGRIAPYLPIGNDLTRFCVVGGRENAAAMRRAYLIGNNDFLRHCFAMRFSNKRLRMEKMLSWMEANIDWTKRCGRPVKYSHLSIRPDQISDQLKLDRSTGPFTFDHFSGPSSDGDEMPQKGDMLVSIDFLVPPSGSGGFKGMFANSPYFQRRGLENYIATRTRASPPGSTLTLKFTSDVNFILNIPELAISFGLPSLLARMVDGKVIDDDLCTELLPVAATGKPSVNPDEECFKYLLTLPGIDLAADYFVARTINEVHTRNLIHICSSRTAPLGALRILLQQPNIDVNIRDSSSRTALHCACFHCDACDLLENIYVWTELDARIARIRMLLENGADPLIADFQNRLPIDTLYETATSDMYSKPKFKQIAGLLLQGKRDE